MTLQIVARTGKRAYPPRVTEFTRTFWDGLMRGRFMITKCRACGHMSFPPKRICAECWARDTEWIDHSGRGILYSQSVVNAAAFYFTAELPFRLGIIDLAEGPQIATRLLGPDPAPPLGSAVELVTLSYEDGPLYAARLPGA